MRLESLLAHHRAMHTSEAANLTRELPLSNPFFDHPILNSPYNCPQRHWQLDVDGHGPAEKKSTMDTYRVPGVNHLGSYGRWAFAEFTEVFQIQADFKATVDANFNKLIERVTA